MSGILTRDGQIPGCRLPQLISSGADSGHVAKCPPVLWESSGGWSSTREYRAGVRPIRYRWRASSDGREIKQIPWYHPDLAESDYQTILLIVERAHYLFENLERGIQRGISAEIIPCSGANVD